MAGGVRCTASAVSELARVEWHGVGGVCRRVYAELEAARARGSTARAASSTRRRTRGATSTSRWSSTTTAPASSGRTSTGRDALNLFLDELTREQRRAIEVVTADGARWIRQLVSRRRPNAEVGHRLLPRRDVGVDALDAAAPRGVERRQGPPGPPGPRPEGKRGRPAKRNATRALEEARRSHIKGQPATVLRKIPRYLTDGQRARLEALKKGAGSRLVRPRELKEDPRVCGQPTAPRPPSCCRRLGCTGPPTARSPRSSPWRRRCAAGATTSSPHLLELGKSNGRERRSQGQDQGGGEGWATASATPTTSWPCSCSGAASRVAPLVKARKKGVKGAKSVCRLRQAPGHTNYRKASKILDKMSDSNGKTRVQVFHNTVLKDFPSFPPNAN